jgi:signal transduction histidine kinase
VPNQRQERIPQLVEAVDAILEALGDAVLVVDESGRFVAFNPAARDLLGDTGGGFDPVDFLERFEVRDEDGVTPVPLDRMPIVRAMRGEAVVEAAMMLRRRCDGREVWLRVNSRRLLGSDGRPLGAVSVFRDVTQRRRAHDMVSLQLALTGILVDAGSVAEAAHGVLEAFCRRLGWSYGALWLGDRSAGTISCAEIWSDRAFPELAHFAEASRSRAMARGEGLPGGVWKTGEPAWIADVSRDAQFNRRDAAAACGLVSAIAFPLVIDRRAVGVIEFLAREERMPDAELLETMADLGRRLGLFINTWRASTEQAQAVAKARFFEAVSHELRTPLNSVLGFAQMLEGGEPLSEKQQRYVENIRTSGEHLLDLVNGVLDLSQVRTGHMHVRAEDVDVAEAIQLAVSRMQPQAAARQLQLDWSAGEALRVRADPRRLGQVLLNLLGNAVKFTGPGGQVDVSAARAGSDVEIAVSDTGVGIARADLSRIFEEFARASHDGRPHSDGTGLGLALSRGLAEAMGGKIRVESRLGRGSTFTIVLPEAAV